MKYFYLFIIVGLLVSCTKEVMTPTGAPVRLRVSPESASLSKGTMKRFVTTAYDQNNNIVNVKPVWSVENNIGIIDSYGHFFAALEAPGPFPKTGYVTASYNNIVAKIPVTILIAPFGIYSETYPGVQHDYNAKIMTWSGAGADLKLYDDYVTPYEGVTSLIVEITNKDVGWWGMGIGHCDPTNLYSLKPINMVEYQNGHLRFAFKSTMNEIKVGVKSYNEGAVNAQLSIKNYYFTNDNKWHEINIPFADFKAIDVNLFFTNIDYYFTLINTVSGDFSVGSKCCFDNVRWDPE